MHVPLKTRFTVFSCVENAGLSLRIIQRITTTTDTMLPFGPTC